MAGIDNVIVKAVVNATGSGNISVISPKTIQVGDPNGSMTAIVWPLPSIPALRSGPSRSFRAMSL